LEASCSSLHSCWILQHIWQPRVIGEKHLLRATLRQVYDRALKGFPIQNLNLSDLISEQIGDPFLCRKSQSHHLRLRIIGIHTGASECHSSTDLDNCKGSDGLHLFWEYL